MALGRLDDNNDKEASETFLEREKLKKSSENSHIISRSLNFQMIITNDDSFPARNDTQSLNDD